MRFYSCLSEIVVKNQSLHLGKMFLFLCLKGVKRNTDLFVSLTSTAGVADGPDDPGPCESRVAEEARAARHRQAVRVRPGVRIRHGCDYCGLNHPLQVLTGRYGINCWNKGTTRTRHVYSVLLWRKKRGKY